jgi:uncharacterized protein YndB with AHSA1/START domain
MTQRSAVHDTFTIKRSYPATPARTFAAFADPDAKARWADSAETEAVGDTDGYLEFDFRVGGHERFAFAMPSGVIYSYDARYYDIVADQRIVYSYEMQADGVADSLSIVTIEFAAEAAGTALTYTEQGVFLDGIDRPADRVEGVTEMLDGLTGYLKAQNRGAQAR